MWNKFSDKKPENDQLCIVEGEFPTIFTFIEDGEFSQWCDSMDSWDCNEDDYWIPYPFPRLKI